MQADVIVVRDLQQLEGVIERGLATFVEVGQALLEIREHRLYRETHDSFEAYCRERWGWSRQRAHQMIEASAVSTMVDTASLNERQARELARLKDEPEAVREVWSEVTEAKGDKVTAADIREAVDRHRGVPKPAPSHARPAPVRPTDEPSETGGLCFECRQPIPRDAESCPSCDEFRTDSVQNSPGCPELSPQQTVIVSALTQSLQPPPEERVYNAVRAATTGWVAYDVHAIADVEPDDRYIGINADAVDELGDWLKRLAVVFRERGQRGIRAVK